MFTIVYHTFMVPGMVYYWVYDIKLVFRKAGEHA